MPSLEKWLLIPDTHVPYHDKKAFKLCLKAAASAKVDNVVILGDFIDCYAVSSHSKSPERRADLRYEVDATRGCLDAIEEVCRGRRIYIAGNHEDRLDRYLADKAPALFSSVKIERELGLANRGWKYVPYKSDTKVGKLNLTHDCGKAGRYAHYDALGAYQGNTVIGHTHRFGYVVEGSAVGKAHVSAMLGWLGDFDSVDYMHRVSARRNWVHGFGIMYREPDGCVHIVPHPIVNGKVVVEGRLIQ